MRLVLVICCAFCGCETVDKNQMYLANEGIWFYDSHTGKRKLWSAQTAAFFLTADGKLFAFDRKGRRVVDPDIIDAQRTAPESRHAKADPEGNWGPAVNGFQVGVRLKTNIVNVDEPIYATVLARNITNEIGHVHVMTHDHGDLILATDSGDIVRPIPEKPPRTFAERLRTIHNNGDYEQWVLPGTQSKREVKLPDSYRLSEGNYRITAVEHIRRGADTNRIRVLSAPTQIQVRAR